MYPMYPTMMPAPYWPQPMGAVVPPLASTSATGFGYYATNVAFAGFADPTVSAKDDKKDKKDDKVDFGKGFEEKAK